MERPVGDKFKINGCVYEVVEDVGFDLEHSCGVCAFSGIDCSRLIDVLGDCCDDSRKDGRAVHFEHFGVDF